MLGVPGAGGEYWAGQSVGSAAGAGRAAQKPGVCKPGLHWEGMRDARSSLG